MESHGLHASHPDIVKRLNRADGHLRNVIAMIEAGRPCSDVAQQLHAVERAICSAKRVLIQDHLDQCLDNALAVRSRSATKALAEFKDITKYL